MAELTEQRITEIIGVAIAQSLSERRRDIADHVCFCSDPKAKDKHDEEHAIIRRVAVILDRAEKTKWAFLMVVLALLAGSMWDSLRGLFQK